MANKEIPFRPKLEGEFRTRFYDKVSSINNYTQSAELEALCDAEINWVENECYYNIEQRKRYRAIWYLLRDFVRASWKAEFKDGIFLMKLPDIAEVAAISNSASEAKTLLRKWMAESRHERIVTYSDFIRRIEADTKNKKSVLSLVADGKELCSRLRKAQSGEIAINEAVKPYLQLVTENGIDSFTGQKISEIWRYFRLTWSTPAETTPGRTMQYLIRDAAHPMHAVIGIASLENGAVAIACRDDFIGWTASTFINDIKNKKYEVREAFNRLISYLDEGIESVDYTELCSDEEIKNPTEILVHKLSDISIAADTERQVLLDQNSDEFISDADIVNSDLSIELLYRRKRADQLSKYINSKIVLTGLINDDEFLEKWEEMTEDETVCSAIKSAIAAQKSKHIGTSILELNVCGAIPPYNEILGGKLVALLAGSPQIIADYRERYSGKRSEIASNLKGEDVIRPAELVYVGTSSLYAVGSSQYNRLKIPSNILDSDFDYEWKEIGQTTGFGTLHISKATTQCLKEATNSDNYRVNHVFGEGPSPKLRLLASSLRELLENSAEDTKEFTKHAMRRIVYGLKLASNTEEYLLGIDELPKYYADTLRPEEGTNRIIEYWQSRWLSHRLNFEPIYERIGNFDINSIVVSNELNNDEIWKFSKLEEIKPIMSQSEAISELQFIRDYYRGISSFADEVSEDLLNSIHVETKLDEAICNAISSGKDVVLTGNPGDGKTHIIRMIYNNRPEILANAEIVLDASTLSDDEIYSKWVMAHNSNKSFCIAINAAVLFALYENHPDFSPIAIAYNQVMNAIEFGDTAVSYDEVVTFDLSKRESLTKEILLQSISKLTDKRHFAECESCQFKESCDVHKNIRLLHNDLFIDRLVEILRRVALKGYHATLREIQAFVSYLIFANRSCNELLSTAGNDKYDISNLVYSGKGKLFNEIKNALDPINVSHPIWDEKVLTNNIPNDSWVEEYSNLNESIDPDNIDIYNLRKRSFYFFNTNGSSILDILDDDITYFKNFISNENDEKLIKDILKKLNSFFGANGLSKELEIWAGHRFNTSPRSVLVSYGKLKAKSFAVGRPRLNPNMNQGIDFTSSFIRFELKDNPAVFLKIDFDMYCFLTEAERGVPVLFMESDLVKKVWRFIEQLQVFVDSDDETANISILDIQQKQKYTVQIDLEEKKYTAISISSNTHNE